METRFRFQIIILHPNLKKHLRVLVVVDSIFWVTGTMAEQIRRRFLEYDILVCSYAALKQIIKENRGRFPEAVDVVHYFINTYSNENHPVFHSDAAIISTIHHVEDESDLFPLSYSDAVQTVCQEWHEYLVQHGADRDNLVCIPNGIDARQFRPARNGAEVNALRAKHGIPVDAFVVGFSAKRSSNTSDRKGVDVLEKLIETSANQKNGLWWVIRGPGWQDLVDRLQKERAPVTYLPFMLPGRELAESYRIMDAYVVTSRIEGGPVPLMEAMACGLPVVSTRVGTALDLIDEGRNGFLAPFGDADFFTSALLNLKSDPNLCRKIGQAARRSIEDKYSWEKVLKNIPKLYSTACNNYINRIGVGAQTDSNSKQFPKQFKKRMDLLNIRNASEHLNVIGAKNGGRYYATLGLFKSPFELENLRRFFFWSYFGVLYFKITNCMKQLRSRI